MQDRFSRGEIDAFTRFNGRNGGRRRFGGSADVGGRPGRCGRVPIIASAIQETELIVSRESIALIFCSDELPDGRTEDFIRRFSRPPHVGLGVPLE